MKANTLMPALAMAAAAWSWVEKMLQLAQRTDAPSSTQGLDEHGRLDGHVQRAGDAHAGQGLVRAVLGADGHEPGHFVLGDLDFAAAEVGQRKVADVEIALRAVAVFRFEGGFHEFGSRGREFDRLAC
ncbi:MAG: hypothetical protein KatS3mg132_666 [Limisphaera sp.]|nr:MAG: hypothetical protein KatS3mg132_666 [Limisphaera sp.]